MCSAGCNLLEFAKKKSVEKSGVEVTSDARVSRPNLGVLVKGLAVSFGFWHAQRAVWAIGGSNCDRNASETHRKHREHTG